MSTPPGCLSERADGDPDPDRSPTAARHGAATLAGHSMSIHLKQLEDVPRSLVGAPHPTVLATEHRVVLIYYTADEHEKAYPTTNQALEPTRDGVRSSAARSTTSAPGGSA